MFMVRVIAVGAAVAWSALGASNIPGDARRGEQLFTSEQCIQCHSLNGKGGTLAPDLSRRVDRDYTPSVMASLMWNHAPDMRSEEHTSELQSLRHLVCRLLLEKKKSRRTWICARLEVFLKNATTSV